MMSTHRLPTVLSSFTFVWAGLLLAGVLALAGCGGSAEELSCEQDPFQPQCEDLSEDDEALALFLDGLRLWLAWNDSSDTYIESVALSDIALDITPTEGRIVMQAGSSGQTEWLIQVDGLARSHFYPQVSDPQQLLQALWWQVDRPRGRWTLRVQARSDWPVGTYPGGLLLHLCQDAACTRSYPGSPMSLPLTLDVLP